MSQKIFTIANLLSLLRILLTPLFIYFLFTKQVHFELLALAIFIIASVTDAYDGYFARKYADVSDIGKFLDPLADKVLMSAAFISFVVMDLIPLWMVILVILRDFTITGIRISMSKHNATMITRTSAKVKTGAQIGVVCFILVYIITQRWVVFRPVKDEIKQYLLTQFNLIYILMLIVTLFTVVTGIEYLVVNKNHLRHLIAGKGKR